MICLPKQISLKFRQALKSGEVNPAKMAGMTTDERREFLGKLVGEENAKFVNTLFESKLLLKNQQRGMITWAKEIAGLKEKTRNDLIAKIEKLDRALNPQEEEQFLSDIVEKRLGVEITEEEAKTITDLTAKMKDLYEGRYEDPNREYFRLKKQLTDFMRESTPEKKPKTILGKITRPVSEVLSVMRSIKTGFDLSAPLRQGNAYIGTSEWTGALKRMFKYARSKEAFDELEVDMMSNKYSDQAMQVKRDLGLTMLGETFTQREEAFASKLTEKIPGLAASARAYEGFLNDLRFNRFVNTLDSLDKAGNSITEDPKAMRELARVIAAATGRGHLGEFEGAAQSLATVLFSPRYLASRLQILANPIIYSGPARTEAAKSLARMAGISASLIGLAKMAGGDIELDPRSSEFGKLRVGDTRFDLTGGMGQYITLAAREASGKTKSPVSHKVTKLGEGFGSATRLSLVGDFLQNKTSPIGSTIRDILKGETYEGEEINIKDPSFIKFLADSLAKPMLAGDSIDAFRQSSGETAVGTGIASTTASFFGAGASTYQYQPRGVKWTALRDQKGKSVHAKAVKDFDDAFQSKLSALEETEKFKNASQNKKNDMIDTIKKQEEAKILARYPLRKVPKEVEE